MWNLTAAVTAGAIASATLSFLQAEELPTGSENQVVAYATATAVIVEYVLWLLYFLGGVHKGDCENPRVVFAQLTCFSVGIAVRPLPACKAANPAHPHTRSSSFSAGSP